MAIKQVNPYLNFNGTAAKAIELYESALGAKTEVRMPFTEVPGMKITEESKGRIMHALLRLGEGVLMLSDTMPDTPTSPKGNCHVCLNFDDDADMSKKFDALSVGAKITFPLHDTFWGAKFGMLTDAFGVQWMFNCEKPKG